MKDKKYKIAVIGGDARQLIVGAELSRAGYEVALYGFGGEAAGVPRVVDSLCCGGSNVGVGELLASISCGEEMDCGTLSRSVGDAVRGCRTVILPLPASSDGTKVSMPLNQGALLKLTTLVELMAQNGVGLVCGGKLPPDFVALCIQRGIKTFDYYESEAFAIANAIPSAEGAIEIAMRETARTLNGSSALVVGYGRIGKVLSRLLSRLGVAVTVSARKPSDLAWIQADGYAPAETGKLAELLCDTRFDIIFNTVPHTVFGERELVLVPRKTLIIDLASKPGGVDIPTADRLSLNVIWALSLPGKVAPVTSGTIIADTVIDALERYGGES